MFFFQVCMNELFDNELKASQQILKKKKISNKNIIYNCNAFPLYSNESKKFIIF